MIIHSIRLKNVKSYGEGPDGNGITVPFQPGVNRIAGKNGSGKTTLIESLGYALFATRPQFEETFDVSTYFLRNGKKAAEIDVTFSHGGQTYRIERGLGLQNKRRSKVIQLSDGSTCAENDEEISAWLCRLLQFPNENRLSELFSKLIGVKQGRLTWPFDSKPSDAKRFFEPLLDVAVFRDCFDRLKPVVDQFQESQHDQQTKLAAVAERIRERDDATSQVETKKQTVTSLEEQLEKLNKAREESRQTKESLEARELSIRNAEKQVGLAKNALELSIQRREAANKHVQESRNAAESVVATEPGYRAWEKAEAALKDLRVRQTEQRRLEKEKSEAIRQKTELDGQAKGSREQANTFAGQKVAKEKERVPLREKLDGLRLRLETTQLEFELKKTAATQSAKDHQILAHLVQELPDNLSVLGAKLEKITSLTEELAAWDPAALSNAQNQEANTEKALQEAHNNFTQARARHKALSEQLKEISGGVCPFLKEPCRQFKSAEIENDAETLLATLKELEKAIKPAETAFRQARNERDRLQKLEAGLLVKRNHLQGLTQEFVADLSTFFPKTAIETADRLRIWAPALQELPQKPKLPSPEAPVALLKESYQQISHFATQANTWWCESSKLVWSRLESFSAEEQSRLADQKDALYHAAELTRLDREIKDLEAREQKQREAAAAAEEHSAKITLYSAGLDQRLATFFSLPEETNEQERIQAASKADYHRFLGAKPLAEQLSARQQEFEKQRNEETLAATAWKTSENLFEEARKGFDPELLTKARAQFEHAGAELATHTANLKNAKNDLLRELERQKEWQAACAARDQIQTELARLQAAIDLTELARKVLKDSAPAVAQHLCDRIAGRAQQLFNQINHDPVALNWDAARYSMRIDPGDRRFAMLSGGEQTKLALSMTLAMIQEFSGLKFCIFDEPTYGVDADSRSKLADTILEAQKAADLEQLLLVSHDDAFEGKIEHVVCIRKLASEGSAPVL